MDKTKVSTTSITSYEPQNKMQLPTTAPAHSHSSTNQKQLQVIRHTTFFTTFSVQSRLHRTNEPQRT